MEKLLPIFPYFGGKRKIADEVWGYLGNPSYYVEPFFGAGAVLFARPHTPKFETINDIDGYVVNFWRSVKHDPETVADETMHICSEIDVLARQRWICEYRRKTDFLENMKHDPEYYDAKIAGYWLYGICNWLGSGFCEKFYYGRISTVVNNNLGTKCQVVSARRQGVFSLARRDNIKGLMQQFYERLRHVVINCGDWERVLSSGNIYISESIAVFLDPPYEHGGDLYSNGKRDERIKQKLVKFCNKYASTVKIVLCGYQGDYDLKGWHVKKWEARKGYATKENTKHRDECLWISPACEVNI